MRDFNKIIEESLHHIENEYKPSCEECVHWKNEWDDYYDNSYCLIKSKGMNCERKLAKDVMESKVRECVKKEFNDLINEVAKKYIEENIKIEYKKYLPFSYSSGSIK